MRVIGCALLLAALPVTAAGKGDKKYVVSVSAARGKVGEPIAAKIKLVPVKGYKVNLEYPIKLTLSSTRAAPPLKKVLRKQDAEKIDATQALFAPRVKASAAGKHAISAVFKFSVCTEKECLMRTETLRWVITAR